ncbi:MAG: DUF2070 family protein [Candidatus Micrarchaeota archaeon]|nr:DUF2070 family protein [Candidatus Micrarchaeota archaeon]
MDGTSAAVNITKILGVRINYYLVFILSLFLFFLYIYFHLSPLPLIITTALVAVVVYLLLHRTLDKRKILFIVWAYYMTFGLSGLLLPHTYLAVIPGAIYAVSTFVLVRYILGSIPKSLLLFLVITLAGMYFYYPDSVAVHAFLLSEVVWLLVMFVVSYAMDKSIRSIFGVSLLEVFSGFFFQWFYDDKRLEKALKKLGTEVDITSDVIAIKTPEKQLFIVVPRFHFGPFGTIGGSRAPYIFSSILGDSIVLHSLTNHDHDLASEEDAVAIAQDILKHQPQTWEPLKFSYKKYQHGHAKAHVLTFPSFNLIGLTREPEVTEDVKAEGESILLGAISPTVENPILYDEHNSSAEKITYFSPTSPEFQEYKAVVKKIKANYPKEAKAAFFKIPSLDPTIGSNGINVLLLQNENQKIALVNIDGNGISQESLIALRKLFKKYKWLPIITTSDSHENNDVAGIVNEIVISPLDLFFLEENLRHVKLSDASLQHYRTTTKATILGSEASSKLLTLLSVSSSYAIGVFVLGLLLNILLIGLLFERWRPLNFII